MTERGHPEITSDPITPLVHWALRSEQGAIHREYLCVDDLDRCVPSEWYKCLLPAKNIDNVFDLKLIHPPAHLGDGTHTSLVIEFRAPDVACLISAGWTINSTGDRVLGSLIKTDRFVRFEERLPPFESLYLGPLPPIVKPNP